MNLIDLKNKLIIQGIKPLRPVRENINEKIDKIDCKIIGITGSVGKSTTAYLVHKYLKECGFKSILYSTITVDSPTSIVNGSTKDIPILNKDELLTIINEAITFEAKYLVLEVNETTIEKGVFDDIDFDIKVLTNINPRHNLELYNETEYINLKKSFFINDKSKHVLCYTGYDKKILDDFLSFGDNNSLISTKYILKKNDINENSINCLLTNLSDASDGLQLEFTLNKIEQILNTNIHFKYNAFNILTSIVILNCMELYNENIYKEFIKNIEIPGRAIVLNKDNRKIIIDQSLIGVERIIEDGQKIKVLTGFVGGGFRGFDNKYKTEGYNDNLKRAHIETAQLLNNIVSKIYYTSQDEANLSIEDLFLNVLPYYDNNKAVLIKNRLNAIELSIRELRENETLLICGMGNKKTMCISQDEMVYFDEIGYVKKILKEQVWDK